MGLHFNSVTRAQILHDLLSDLIKLSFQWLPRSELKCAESNRNQN